MRPTLEAPKAVVFSDVNPDVVVLSPFELTYNEESINKSLETIFTTPIRSRVFRRSFGSRLASLLFDPIDTVTSNLIGADLREAAARWETRIDSIEVSVLPDIVNQQYFVELTYRIPKLGNKLANFKFNLASGG